MKKLFNILLLFFPWRLRRLVLVKFYHYQIHPSAWIGFSYIYPDKLIMRKGAYIGHLNVAIHLHCIEMEEDASISQWNWITGYPLNEHRFFAEFENRMPKLYMGKDSAITKRHLVDCTDMVEIGAYTSIAGYSTQILTHSTSLQKNDQSCSSIKIGHHCFVGTRSIILPGSVLPNHSILGAGAVLKKQYEEEYMLYGGVPARPIKRMDENLSFFHRTYRPKGHVPKSGTPR